MSPYLAEFLGTALLLLFGNGVVCNVVLAKTKGHGSGWIVISAGWGVAVFIGAFCSEQFSGAHLNPAVSAAMVVAGELSTVDFVGYVFAQMLGAMSGTTLCYLFYSKHFAATNNADDKLACFCNAPSIAGNWQAFLCECIGTFALVFPIFMIASPTLEISGIAADPSAPTKLGLGTLGLLPVGLIVFGIGLSLGGPTGYAINPARDLGPRIMHALLPIPHKRDSNWGYAMIPVIGPITGGVLAALLARLLGI